MRSSHSTKAYDILFNLFAAHLISALCSYNLLTC